VFVYVSEYNYVNICTSHNNKPFTYLESLVLTDSQLGSLPWT